MVRPTTRSVVAPRETPRRSGGQARRGATIGIANQMFDYITAGISSLIDDDALTRMARGTCLGIVELVLSMMEHAIPADHAEPPVVATEYVRLIAGRGIPLEDVLRSYRLGHACFARIWADAIMELTQDPAELVRAYVTPSGFCSRLSTSSPPKSAPSTSSSVNISTAISPRREAISCAPYWPATISTSPAPR